VANLDVNDLIFKRYINAFLNTEGGTIYFGVRDDGVVLGAPLNRKARDSLRLNV